MIIRNKHHKAAKLHIKRGDLVEVRTGNCRGKRGVVLSLFTKSYRALVEGVNKVSRHSKPSAAHPKGRIVQKEAALHLSNLMLVDPATDRVTRVGRMRDQEGKLRRYSKKTGKIINHD